MKRGGEVGERRYVQDIIPKHLVIHGTFRAYLEMRLRGLIEFEVVDDCREYAMRMSTDGERREK